MGAFIRMATVADAPAIQAIYAPIVANTPISFEIDPPSVAEMAGRIAKTTEQYPWLVCVEDDQVPGYVYASQHRARLAYQWGADVTVYIHEQARKRGIGRALYTALFGLLAEQGYYAAYAGITLPNAPSVGIHEAVGFVPVGIYEKVGYKTGMWRDVGWWQLSLRERDDAPTPPRPVGELLGSPAWDAALQRGVALLRPA